MTAKKRKKKQLIVIVCSAVLAVLLAGGLLAWQLGWLAQPVATIEIGLPGSVSDSSASFQSDSDVAALLEARMKTLLASESSGLLTAFYRLPGNAGSPPAYRPDLFLAADQLAYGTYLLEQRRQEEFTVWWQAFSEQFLNEDGSLRTMTGTDSESGGAADDFWRINLSGLRLLAQSCSIWPDNARLSAVTRLSDCLLDNAKESLPADFLAVVPTPAPIVDPAATPTPKPSATPAATEPSRRLATLRLASVDLFTMRELAELDSRWQTLYDQYLPIVGDGLISEDLPLYALGYSDNQDSYLYYNGTSPVVDTEEALLTLLHLCEVGAENPRSLNWLRDQLYNSRALYTAYHIAQGQPTTSEECVAGYAIVARIARLTGDENLYNAAVKRLLWHQATSQTSLALSAIFRKNGEGQILVWAADNAHALLALR